MAPQYAVIKNIPVRRRLLPPRLLASVGPPHSPPTPIASVGAKLKRIVASGILSRKVAGIGHTADSYCSIRRHCSIATGLAAIPEGCEIVSPHEFPHDDIALSLSASPQSNHNLSVLEHRN